MPALAMFLLGLLLLVLGADSLLRAAAGLGQGLGLKPQAAALASLALVGAVPTLAVSAFAMASGAGELALGNAIGNSIVLLGLVLGLGAIAKPLLAGTRLVAGQLVFLLVAAGLVLLFGLDGAVSAWEGALLVAGYAGVLAFVFARGRQEAPAVQAELAEFATTSTILVQNLLRVAFAAALFWFGSRWLVQGALLLGPGMGLDALSTGLTLLAIGSALPALVVVALAAFRGQGNVVIGFVLGACLANLLLVVGVLALLRPLPLPLSLLQLELPATMAFVILLFPLLGDDRHLGRRDGAVLLIAFLAWLGVELFSALR